MNPISSEKKILVIDDSEDALRLVGRVLEVEGYRTYLAKEGKTGLELAQKEEPDLILLDIRMPGMDGVQIMNELRKDPLLKTIPVIMVSAVDDVDAKVRFLDTGADDYVIKPYDPKELLSRIRALSRRTGEQSMEKRFNAKLADYLIGKFEKKGYGIFTSIIPSFPKTPTDWRGPPPDLLLEKWKKKIAVSMESMESLLNPRTVEHWKKFLENPGVTLKIVVHNKECYKIAIRLKKEYGVPCGIILEREKDKIQGTWQAPLLFFRYAYHRYIYLMLLCVAVAFLLSLFGGGLLLIDDYLNQGVRQEIRHYKPRDDERQLRIIEEKLKELEKKR